MPFAENFTLSGSFTLGSSFPQTVTVNTGFLPTRVELINSTRWGSGASAYLQRATWDNYTPTSTFVQYAASASTLFNNKVTSNGISQYDGHAASPFQLQLGPKLAGTNTAIATGTFTISSTASLYAGATILMTQNSVNKKLGGVFFTVSTVASSTTFTIANSSAWLNTASFTDGAETFYVQLVVTPSLYYPQNAQIAYISAANPAVVTTTTNTNLTVGQQVRLYVPTAFAMTQANFTTAVVSAVSGNQITLGGANAFGVSNGLNSSAFTAFAWPAQTGIPYTPAYMVPIGSGPYPISPGFYNDDTYYGATSNQAYYGFTVGTNILQTTGTFIVAASDVITWTAWRGDV